MIIPLRSIQQEDPQSTQTMKDNNHNRNNSTSTIMSSPPPCSSSPPALSYSYDSTDALLDRIEQHHQEYHNRRHDLLDSNHYDDLFLGIRESAVHILESAEQVIGATDADMLDRIMQDNSSTTGAMMSSDSTASMSSSILRSINRVNGANMMRMAMTMAAGAPGVEDYTYPISSTRRPAAPGAPVSATTTHHERVNHHNPHSHPLMTRGRAPPRPPHENNIR